MSVNRNDLKEFRRKSAESRNVAWNKLSPEAQLKDLDLRLGSGEGAVRQRAKIGAKIEAQKRLEDKKQKKQLDVPVESTQQEKSRQRDKKR